MATRSGKPRKSSQSAPAPQRRAWDDRSVAALKKLARQNTPTRVLALKLDRTEGSIRYAASHYGISLKPTNQRPYG